MLTLNDGRDELWQWDTGRTLAVDADCSQVHFSNKVFGRSIDVDVVDGVAIIPDVLLQTDKDLNVWAFVGTAENGYTKISKTFRVNRRNKPADYVFTPVEQTTIAEIAAIAQSVRDDADAGRFDGAQGPEGPIGPVGPKGDQGATGPAGPKGDTGEQGLKGDKGEKGDKGDTGTAGADGKDGTSATHSWNGTVLTVTSASGTSSSDLKGDKGDKGDTGPAGKDGTPGADGKTPEYGVDYGTPEQIAEIAQHAAGILQPDVNQIKEDLADKQEKLIAGDNITIGDDGKTISATGTGGGNALWHKIFDVTTTEEVADIEFDATGYHELRIALYVPVSASGGNVILYKKARNNRLFAFSGVLSTSDTGYFVFYTSIASDGRRLFSNGYKGNRFYNCTAIATVASGEVGQTAFANNNLYSAGDTLGVLHLATWGDMSFPVRTKVEVYAR